MSEHVIFDDEVRRRWVVRRDECYDQYIRLNGPNALGKHGLDHIYLIGPEKVGLWITSGKVNQILKRLMRSVPTLQVEQIGDGEAVFSCGIKHFDKLCAAARAKKRRQISEAEKQRLRRISPLAPKDTHCNSQLQRPEQPRRLPDE